MIRFVSVDHSTLINFLSAETGGGLPHTNFLKGQHGLFQITCHEKLASLAKQCASLANRTSMSSCRDSRPKPSFFCLKFPSMQLKFRGIMKYAAWLNHLWSLDVSNNSSCAAPVTMILIWYDSCWMLECRKGLLFNPLLGSAWHYIEDRHV